MNIIAREASLRPFKQAGLRWWLGVAALTLVVLTGLAAWVLQLKGGMGVAGYNDHAFWAIYIATSSPSSVSATAAPLSRRSFG